MKKIIASVIIISAFVIYSFIHANSGLIAVAPKTPAGSSPAASTATPTSSSSAATPPSSSATAGPTSTSSGQYKNGSYTGSVADAQWGVIQVQAIIKNGKIADVQFLQYPNERSRSVEINTYADPMLTSEAIQAQNANVDIVSGATDSSEAFIQSLTDALTQAHA